MKNKKLRITFALVLFIVAVALINSRVYATGGTLKSGWNMVNWQTEWGSGVKYSSLPVGCDQLSIRKNNSFDPWVRGYSSDKSFETGKNYYINCTQETTWSW